MRWAVLLDLSERAGVPANPPDADTAARALARHGIRFLVLNRAAASAPLASYVRDTLPTTLVDAADDRELYVVDAPPSE